MGMIYEKLALEKLQNALKVCETMVEFDASVARQLIQEFLTEVKTLGIFTPYLPTYALNGVSHRIRWIKIKRDLETGKVVAVRDAPKTEDGHYMVSKFSLRNAKLRELISEYETKFRILRTSIKQTKELTKSLNSRINILVKEVRKTKIGEITLYSLED